MTNVLKIELGDGGTLKVKIQSEGERDLSAVTTAGALYSMIEATEAQRMRDEHDAVPEQPTEPPVA